MMIPVDEPGQSRVTENNTDSSEGNITVEVMTFDSWWEDNGMPDIAAVKVDVEGHELQVFEGMLNSFSKGAIGSIVFERHQQCDDQDPVVQLLRKYNYKIFKIHKGLRQVKIIELGQSTRLRDTPDYVAVLASSSAENRLFNMVNAN
jgi:hypothetical protein